MKFWFKGHHYNSHIAYTVWNFLKYDLHRYNSWFGHEDDCCDYWIPISDPRAQRAFMLDDDLGLVSPKDK